METNESVKFNKVKVAIIATDVKSGNQAIACILAEDVLTAEVVCEKMSNNKTKFSYMPVYEQTVAQFLQYSDCAMRKVAKEVTRRRNILQNERPF